MYKIRKFTITCPECSTIFFLDNIDLVGTKSLTCECGEEVLDLDKIREDVLEAIVRLDPNDLQSWAEIERERESLDPDTLRELGNIQGWDVYLDPYGKPWLFRGEDKEEPGNAWMLPIFRHTGKGKLSQKTANRPRDKSGRLTKMLDMDQLVEALRKAGGGPCVVAELKDILGVDPRTIRSSYAQVVNKPWETPIKGRKSGNTWLFWLEEEQGEPEEEAIEEPKGEFHNDLNAEGVPLICNVCGKVFKKRDICYAVDRLKMVDGEEGKINAILQVCSDCMPEYLRKASWDLVKN